MVTWALWPHQPDRQAQADQLAFAQGCRGRHAHAETRCVELHEVVRGSMVSNPTEDFPDSGGHKGLSPPCPDPAAGQSAWFAPRINRLYQCLRFAEHLCIARENPDVGEGPKCFPDRVNPRNRVVRPDPCGHRVLDFAPGRLVAVEVRRPARRNDDLPAPEAPSSTYSRGDTPSAWPRSLSMASTRGASRPKNTPASGAQAA